MDVKMVVSGLGGLVLRMRMDCYPLAWEGPHPGRSKLRMRNLEVPETIFPCRRIR